MKLFSVTFKDNPLFYSYNKKKWTDFGINRTNLLKNTLTGVSHRRLILGEWCSSEGLVFPEFDPEIHVINTLPSDIWTWDFYLGVDYGHTSPFVCSWFAYNPKTDIIICAKEWRYTETLIDEHINRMKTESIDLHIITRVCDHDTQMNHQLEDAGLATEDANKEPGSVLRGCLLYTSPSPRD